MQASVDEISVNMEILEHGMNLPIPEYQTKESSGMDLHAAIEEDLEIKSGDKVIIPTGIALAIPQGYEAQIRPRSGLAAKHNITVLNTPGTIDSDYRGEIKAIIINHGRDKYTVKRGDRIAQIIFSPIARAKIKSVSKLSETIRGEGGFGSTGIRE